MTTSATNNDPSSTTSSPTTLANAFLEDIIIQYIIKPTIGEHPILSKSVHLLLVGSYIWNCSVPSTAPFCNRTLDFAVIMLLLVPVILTWYVIYKQRCFAGGLHVKTARCNQYDYTELCRLESSTLCPSNDNENRDETWTFRKRLASEIHTQNKANRLVFLMRLMPIYILCIQSDSCQFLYKRM